MSEKPLNEVIETLTGATPNINVYGCGGCGINIGSKLISDPNLNVVLVDSSKSNVKNIEHDQIYLIRNMDGAGRNRAETYEEFDAIPVMAKYPHHPKLNIVIHSLTGGTGAVVGPAIAAEISKAGGTVIVILVDSDESTIEFGNSYKTLYSYNNMVDFLDNEINIAYIAPKTRAIGDEIALDLVGILSLASDPARTSEIDSADLRNLFNFTKAIKGVDKTVGMIFYYANDQPNDVLVDHPDTTVVVSSMLVTKNVDTVISNVVPQWQTKAVITDPNFNEEPYRLDVVVGYLPILLESINEKYVKAQNLLKVSTIAKAKEVKSVENSFIVL